MTNGRAYIPFIYHALECVYYIETAVRYRWCIRIFSWVAVCWKFALNVATQRHSACSSSIGIGADGGIWLLLTRRCKRVMQAPEREASLSLVEAAKGHDY
jgi:hypothetical protein